MNIYAFNGSPRADGPARQAIELLLEGMYKEADALKGDGLSLFGFTWNLQWMHVEECLDCDMCLDNGGRCILRDEFRTMGEDLAGCEVLVFATPVVCFGMSAQLKKALDRMLHGAAPNSLKGKKAFLLVTGEPEADEEGYVLIERQMQNLCGRLGVELLDARFIEESAQGDLRGDARQAEEIRGLYKLLLPQA